MIELTKDEKELFAKIKERYQQIMKMIESEPPDENYETRLLDECGEWAYKLYTKISERGIILECPKKLIISRGGKMNSRYFFQHIHTIERLLEFIEL
ncbi:hypothetical protein KJ656_08955 [bacterium]|nr:hypothetical protein [bacterium]